MEIKVNGDLVSVVVEAPCVPDILKTIGLDPELSGIAVALNMEMVPRSLWDETKVNSGDELEVITARQGG